MKKCRITVMRMVCHEDLMEQYENPVSHACDMKLGQVFIANGWNKPEGMCNSAWESMSSFVMTLAHGGGGRMNLKERARQLKIDIPAVFLSLKSKETPVLAKLVAGITVAYALSPIDLIPDFIPVLGYLDDVITLPVLIALTIKLIPSVIWGFVVWLILR